MIDMKDKYDEMIETLITCYQDAVYRVGPYGEFHGKVAKIKNIKEKEDGIWFCVEYISNMGHQCGTIPFSSLNMCKLNTITGSKKYKTMIGKYVLIFVTAGINPFICGIGDYNKNLYIMWNPERYD